MSFNTVDELLKMVMGWEKDIDQFYSMIEDFLENKKSRKLASLMHLRHQEILGKLNGINIAGYQNIEFVKNVPLSVWSEKMCISAKANMEEVFSQMLGYEEELLNYYKHIRDICVYHKSKDVFDVLVRLKENQVKDIRSLMNGCELAM